MAIEEIGLFPIEMAIYEKQKGGSIQAHEGDKGGRGLLLTLKDKGEPFDSTGIDLRLGFKDANGEEKLYDFQPVAPLLGKFKINYPEEMLLEQGGKVVNVEVKAYESLTGQVINFTPLYVYVNPEMVSDGQLIDSQEGSVLLKMLTEVQTVQDQLQNIDPVLVDNVVTVSGQIIPQEEARVLAENNRVSNEVIRNQLYNQLLLLKIDLESIESELDTYPQREIERQENEVLREQLKAQLQSLQTDLNNAIQVALNAKGEKGEPFRHSDFTQEQLADLKGEKGDSGITVEDRAKLDNVPADTEASLSALTTDVNAQLEENVQRFENIEQQLEDGTAGIDDGIVSEAKVWSSAKIKEQIQLIPKGDKGDKGDAGSIDNLDITDIEEALGYAPASKDDIGDVITLSEEKPLKGWWFENTTIDEIE